MINEWRRLIEQIHAGAPPLVIVVTGGGASAIADLLRVPGGSRTVLEGAVPYSAQALANWLGRPPEHYCVEETALAMAAVARQRACQLAQTGEASSAAAFVLGISCTASLASAVPKKGDHRCHIAVQTRSATRAYTLVMQKGARDRDAEEDLVGRLILTALARQSGVIELPPLELREGEVVQEQVAVADSLLVDLLEKKVPLVWSSTTGEAAGDATDLGRDCSLLNHPRTIPAGVLPGSFHPLHHGHRQLREVAERILGGPVAYEMSIGNVDKPPLDFLSIERRRRQGFDADVALTMASTFLEKSRALPGVAFVVGVDTAERILQAKYYGGVQSVGGVLEQIRAAGCRFLVAGRITDAGFQTLRNLQIPAEYRDLFAEIPADEFREDISSTELRRQGIHERQNQP
jgi:nicotinamide mononucleotide (NMN) deamidase PncC